jgi:1,4-dihydroxy-2-naphthoate octaprenyltransferase
MRGNRFGKGFWQVADPKIWIASTVPMAVGAALAFGITGQFNWYWFLVSVAGVYAIEIGKNAANDLVDYMTGVDLLVTPEKKTPFSGGKRAIVDGNLTLREAAFITVAALGIGGMTGLYITFFREAALFWIGTSGLFFAAAYSLPPFKLAYRGLGELVVGVTFGPLIVCGTFVVQTGFLSIEPLLVSLPIGFLIANVLFINQYPDYEADSLGGKRNWVVRLGKEKGLKIYLALFVLAYISLCSLFVMSGNPFWLLPLLTLPLVGRAVQTAARERNNIPGIISANANTIKTYQLTGAGMTVAALATRFFPITI